MSDLLLSFVDARKAVEQHAATPSPPGEEQVNLCAAHGRVLASPITADRDLPPFNRSTRDGFAVRSADVREAPVTLQRVGEVRAGTAWPRKIAPGETVEIMTGAPVPEGADAVAMVEHTNAVGTQVEVVRTVQAGENVAPRGSEALGGSVLVAAGTVVDEAVVGVAASVGAVELTAFRRPRVAILATGDELVRPDEVPGPTQIRNANSAMLAALVQKAGAEAVILPVAPDKLEPTRALVQQGLDADLLLLAGGVSAGKYDLVEDVLDEYGAEFIFTGALIQPGKPIVFGRVGNKYFFGLPGNPVSVFVTFTLFVRPLLEALCGAVPSPLRFVRAALRCPINVKAGLTRFLPAHVSIECNELRVEQITWQGSGDLVALARSNCFIVVRSDREHLAAGEQVEVLLR